MTTETGQIVQLIVGEERKQEPGHVQTQLQLMVVQIVLGRQFKLRTVTHNLVQVDNTLPKHLHFLSKEFYVVSDDIT